MSKSALKGKRSFSASVGAFVATSEKRLDAVFKESVQRTIDIAQTPVAKGGKMRVDTGFLRNSGTVSLVGMPSGQRRPLDENDKGTEQDASVEIAKAGPGATIWFGWSAEYARPREYLDGFLRSAAQRWRATVAEVAAELKERIK